ncbi:hypothetical protein TYRP_017509, partial [Tyrophagus putrescentiae]
PKTTALDLARKKATIEQRNANQTKIKNVESNINRFDHHYHHQQLLLEQYQQQVVTISQSTVIVGEGQSLRPLDRVIESVFIATGMHDNSSENEYSTGSKCLLIRGICNNHNFKNDENPNKDRTIAYCRVLKTKSKIVSSYVKYCVEMHLTKSMTGLDRETQKTMLIGLLGTLEHERENFLFNSSVTYLIACHITKRLLQHMNKLEFHAFREFVTSHNANLVCFHQLNAVKNADFWQNIKTEMGSLQKSENIDRFLTLVPLEQARRVLLTTANSDIQDRIYTLISKVAKNITD